MRSSNTTDTNILLSTVTVLGFVVLLKLPEVLQFLGNRLAQVWWFLGQIF